MQTKAQTPAAAVKAPEAKPVPPPEFQSEKIDLLDESDLIKILN